MVGVLTVCRMEPPTRWTRSSRSSMMERSPPLISSRSLSARRTCSSPPSRTSSVPRSRSPLRTAG